MLKVVKTILLAKIKDFWRTSGRPENPPTWHQAPASGGLGIWVIAFSSPFMQEQQYTDLKNQKIRIKNSHSENYCCDT